MTPTKHLRCVRYAILALPLVSACAKVDPGTDFHRASQLITSRTGAPSAYPPSADAAVKDNLNALLSDGLTVDEAVRLALLKSPALQSVFQEIGASRAELGKAAVFGNPFARQG